MLIVCLYLFSCSNKEEAQPPPEMENAGSPTEQRFVSKSAAQEVASLFFSDSQDGKRTKSDKVVGSVEPINDAIGTPLAYVINYTGGGWAIVSATQDYYPILAHSDESQFILDTTDMNSGLKAWINETSRAIESSEDLEPEIASQIALEWLKYTPEVAELRVSPPPSGANAKCRARLKELNEAYSIDGWYFTTLATQSGNEVFNNARNIADMCGSPYENTIVGLKSTGIRNQVGPLLTTTWNQEYGYNALCPNQYPAGCVAIAVAQIMKFHRVPATTFDWSNMPDASGDAYATQFLIAKVGSELNTNYGPESSSATDADAIRVLDAYGYSAAKIKHDYYDVRTAIWNNRIPVYMSGKDSPSSGHAWVCDGALYNYTGCEYYVEYLYDNTYDNSGETLIDLPGGSGAGYYRFHMNWGWGIRYNGWYIGVDSPNGDFKNNRQNIYVSSK